MELREWPKFISEMSKNNPAACCFYRYCFLLNFGQQLTQLYPLPLPWAFQLLGQMVLSSMLKGALQNTILSKLEVSAAELVSSWPANTAACPFSLQLHIHPASQLPVQRPSNSCITDEGNSLSIGYKDVSGAYSNTGYR